MARMLIRTRSVQGKLRGAFIVRVAFFFGIPLSYYIFASVVINNIGQQSAEPEPGIHANNYEN